LLITYSNCEAPVMSVSPFVSLLKVRSRSEAQPSKLKIKFVIYSKFKIPRQLKNNRQNRLKQSQLFRGMLSFFFAPNSDFTKPIITITFQKNKLHFNDTFLTPRSLPQVTWHYTLNFLLLVWHWTFKFIIRSFSKPNFDFSLIFHFQKKIRPKKQKSYWRDTLSTPFECHVLFEWFLFTVKYTWLVLSIMAGNTEQGSVSWQMITCFSCFKLAVGIVKKICCFNRNDLF